MHVRLDCHDIFLMFLFSDRIMSTNQEIEELEMFPSTHEIEEIFEEPSNGNNSINFQNSD